MLEKIDNYWEEHAKTMDVVRGALSKDIAACAQGMVEVFRRGSKVLILGNGGSAADAQHFAAELMGRFLLDRKPLPAIALTTDTSLLTAVGNDFGFDEVFRRQIEALAQPGDYVFGLSTSGNSANVQAALVLAKELGCYTVGLLGRDGGRIAPLVDLNLTVPVKATPHIQEAHIAIIHLLCDLVEQQMFQEPI